MAMVIRPRLSKSELPVRKSIPCTIAVAAILAASCTSVQPVIDTKDLSYLYNPSKTSLTPRVVISNTSAESSLLSIRFPSDQLFFSEANPRGIPIAELLVTVKLLRVSPGRMLADTAFLPLSIVKEQNRESYVYNIPVRTNPKSEYIAEVKTLDRLRSLFSQSFMPFNTLSDKNRYCFAARSHLDNQELFSNVLKTDEFVNLLYLKGHPDSLYIAFYKPFKIIPDPPSMLLPEKVIDYGPDTIVSIPYSETLPIMFPREGIYLCSVDSNALEGFTFFNFGNTFPEMTAPGKMIEPLAYITSANELEELRSASKPKMALDNFWIKRGGGNIEKARELIRIFYTRVVYSNLFFTSYKEGWRTERGMIYLIYGPPDKVYKNQEGESWGYKKPVIKSSWGYGYRVKEDFLFFNFKKKESIFSDNDYYLSRSETLVTSWDKAIAAWNNGIVFRFDNPEKF
jgi:GWxTD domain-containing protein